MWVTEEWQLEAASMRSLVMSRRQKLSNSHRMHGVSIDESSIKDSLSYNVVAYRLQG